MKRWMNRTVFWGLMFGMMVSHLAAGPEVRNGGKPLRGEWKFSPREVWSVVEVQDEILAADGAVALHENRVYYYDDRLSKVYVFDSEGKSLFDFGRKGEGPGEFKFVWGLSQFDDTLAVHDDQRYQLFDLKGRFLKTVKSQGDGEAILSAGLLLYSQEDESVQSLHLYDAVKQTSALVRELPAPIRLTAQANGLHLRVRDSNIATSLFVAVGADRFVFGQSGEYRIYLCDKRGNVTGSFSIPDRERPSIPQAYKKSRYANLKLNGATLSQAMLRQLTEGIPDEGPHFRQLVIHDSGAIWVMLPHYDAEGKATLDLFSPDGRYLYRAEISMPEGVEFDPNSWAVWGDNLVVFSEDADGEGALRGFKINLPNMD